MLFFSASMMLTTLPGLPLLSPLASSVDFELLAGLRAFFLRAINLSRLCWIGSETMSGDQRFVRFRMTASTAETPLASDVLSISSK